MLNGKNILITGGTGSLGTALTKKLLTFDVKTIRIFSRDENKQIQMEEQITFTYHVRILYSTNYIANKTIIHVSFLIQNKYLNVSLKILNITVKFGPKNTIAFT